jgi:hypothetical protein
MAHEDVEQQRPGPAPQIVNPWIADLTEPAPALGRARSTRRRRTG